MTKILLVEDDKSLREIYGVRLLAEGYDIISAGDGEAALAMAIKERPSLIVSDVMMPKISGFDMLDILRSTTETKDIKVIMMTALSSEDQRARGEALGADRYLVKSQVGIEDVVRTVHEVLGDAPVAGVSQPNAFGSVSGPRPAPSTAIPPRPVSPIQPQPNTQAPPLPQTMPVAPPAFSAAAQPQPQVQHMQPTQPASSLPQPTAPFSTTRPASLGERVIHPISQSAGPQSDIGSLMAQELNQAPPTAPAGPQPTIQPAAPLQQQPAAVPLPPPPPTPSVSLTPVTPQPPAPASPQPVAPAPQPPREDSGISFEETPRQSPPLPPAPTA